MYISDEKLICVYFSGTSEASPSTPIKVKRMRLISKYIASPTAKKKVKERHCFFCQTNIYCGSNLDEHLQCSKKCKKNYLAYFKKCTIEPIIALCFPCLFCQYSGKRLSNHLNKSEICRKGYLSRFKVRTLE